MGNLNLSISEYTLPIKDGSIDQVMKTDGNGTVTWQNDSGISNLIEDTSPQLGGMLDVNGNGIGNGTEELVTFVENTSAVNHVEIENASTGEFPVVKATGDDTDIALSLEGKGLGGVWMNNYNLVKKDGGDAQIYVRSYGGESSIDLRSYNGTESSPSAILDEDYFGQYRFSGADSASSYGSGQARIVAKAEENWSTTNHGCSMYFYTTSKGSANETVRVKIRDNGNLDIEDGYLNLIAGSTKGIASDSVQTIGVAYESYSSVNYLEIKSTDTGNAPQLSALGSDTNIDLKLFPKGTGVVTVAGTTNYESNISDDDDIPNKKYVDEATYLGAYTVAGLPTASSYSNKIALATDASGGRTLVLSDGTNWKVFATEGTTVTT